MKIRFQKPRRDRVAKWIAAALLFAVLGLAYFIALRARAQSARVACSSNLASMRTALIVITASDETVDFPPSIQGFADISPEPTLYLCPVAGSRGLNPFTVSMGDTGPVSNVAAWTDYVYVQGLRADDPHDVAVILCPPSNHGNRNGSVLFLGGGMSSLPADDLRELLHAPWALSSASTEKVKDLKKRVVVSTRLKKGQSGSRD